MYSVDPALLPEDGDLTDVCSELRPQNKQTQEMHSGVFSNRITLVIYTFTLLVSQSTCITVCRCRSMSGTSMITLMPRSFQQFVGMRHITKTTTVTVYAFLAQACPTMPCICLVITPRTYAQVGLSNRLCPSLLLSVVVCKNIFITADLEAKTISKQEVNDEIRHILACMYLVKHRVVSFSAFSTLF